MSRKIRHIVTALLLISYLFVGAVAHLDAFDQLFWFVASHQKLSETKPTQSVPVKVCWTQHKHIPTVARIAPISPTLSLSHDFPRQERLDLISVSPMHPYSRRKKHQYAFPALPQGR